MFRFTACVFCFILFNSAIAQRTSPGSIVQGIEQLGTVGTVLYIAAHPDDENTRLLTWLSQEKGVRTAYLSLTRGDGGQNLVGKEQGDLLGVLRTQELLQARSIDGAEQYFTRARDFGYSKSPEETFAFWNRDSVLADVVWVIRTLKPDIIITRFPATGEGGHGHHTASAILAADAFDAAANPKMFPGQLKYTSVWQPEALFWNTFNFGGNNTTSPDQVQIDVGGYNAILGRSYGEISSESRTMHKSQGFGTSLSRGSQIEFLKQIKGKEVEKDIFEHVKTNWSRFDAGHINNLIDKTVSTFNYRNPAEVLPQLFEIKTAIEKLPAKDVNVGLYKNFKLNRIDRLIADAAGLFVQSSSVNYSATPGQKVEIVTQVIARGNAETELLWLNLPGAGSEKNEALEQNKLYLFRDTLILPENIPFTSPYWLMGRGTEGALAVPDYTLRGKAENPPPMSAELAFRINGNRVVMNVPLQHTYSDPVRGQVTRPFEIIPPVTVSLPEPIFLFSESVPRTVPITIQAQTDSISGTVELIAENGWQASLHPSYRSFTLNRKGEEKVIEAVIVPNTKYSQSSLKVQLISDGKKYDSQLTRVEYAHIPSQVVLTPAEAKLSYIGLKKHKRNIGYIPGAGDAVASSLQQVGYDVTILDEAMLTYQDLSLFDAIVTGVRAFNTNEWLSGQYSRLQEYVKKGGNLIVQYNTNNRLAPLETGFAPYPFTITRNRVTDENSPVSFKNPSHPVLNFPNKITEADFKGWVQERGIYFAGDLAPEYQTILEMNDPGEAANEGSLIIAPFGKGNFVYTGLSFFRELPAGVPGAYKLFINLLSLPQNKADD